MKKAILNLGLLSMMMMLTSFTSVPDIINDGILDHNSQANNKGIYTSAGKKLDYLNTNAIGSRNIILKTSGQVISDEKKLEF